MSMSVLCSRALVASLEVRVDTKHAEPRALLFIIISNGHHIKYIYAEHCEQGLPTGKIEREEKKKKRTRRESIFRSKSEYSTIGDVA